MNILPSKSNEAESLNTNHSTLNVDLFQFKRQLGEAMSRFVEIELDLGQTFAEAAVHSSWTEDVLHNRRLARRAYDTAMRLMGQAKLDRPNTRRISKKLLRLKLSLYQLGDPV